MNDRMAGTVLAPATIDEIDRWATSLRLTRSRMIRVLLDEALVARGAAPTPEPHPWAARGDVSGAHIEGDRED